MGEDFDARQKAIYCLEFVVVCVFARVSFVY